MAVQAVPVADGFLGRWSQRKHAQREGKVPEEPASTTVNAPAPMAPKDLLAQAPQTPLVPEPRPESAPVSVPAPTLEDVKALNADSSFAPFVSRGVSPEVRNAAMKKLFTDPHYNVMDRLDIYIDDYSLADPMPAAMLRQMASAKFLNLFDDEPASASDVPSEHTQHDHTDLRLQPDHAAGRSQPERVPEPATDITRQPVPPRSP